MEIKTKYYISHWTLWPMCDENKPGGVYVLSESPNNKEGVIYFEADSIKEIIKELPGMGIDIADVSVCTVQSLADWMSEKGISKHDPSTI
ncbi:MAG: hypothetical protein IK092_07405 [Muribaculaceae bacterium]|nr:hypothetical protein [Muribaculaceae bacterium]